MYNLEEEEELLKYRARESLKSEDDNSALQEAMKQVDEKKLYSNEQMEEFQRYNKLFNTNRKFRKAVYAQRFSRTAIKPSAF